MFHIKLKIVKYSCFKKDINPTYKGNGWARTRENKVLFNLGKKINERRVRRDNFKLIGKN